MSERTLIRVHKEAEPTLNRYTSAQIGRALEQVGIKPIARKLSGKTVKLGYVPIPKKKQNIWDS